VFIEDDRGPRLPRPRVSPIALVGLGAAIVATAVVALVAGGSDDSAESATSASAQERHLEVLSTQPLSTSLLELQLERRFLRAPDDDESDVTCSEREPRPAYSLRHCILRFPGGIERQVVVLTDANGAEVLSER
jgi:hypothetical protein